MRNALEKILKFQKRIQKPVQVHQLKLIEKNSLPSHRSKIKRMVKNLIVFVERKRDSARQHPNLNSMSVWEGKVPSSSNPAYAFNKQQDNSAEYADVPYMPQLMGAAREAITDVL